MKKYHLFLNITLVLLCLFPLLYGMLTGFRSSATDPSDLAAIVEGLDISPTQSTQILNIFKSYLTGSVESSGTRIFSVIISNSVFVFVGYIFVEVLTFIPKLAVWLLRIFVRKEE